MLAVEPAPEFTRLDSYIQYIIGMNIVSKSPYSATSCPEIYSLMHICGLTQGKPRSKHATLPADGVSDQTVWIGAIMAYALMDGHQHSTLGTITHLSPELQNRAAALEGTRNAAAQNLREAKSGVNWMCRIGDQEVAYNIRKFAAGIWNGLIEGRENSIAKFLHAKSTVYYRLCEEYEENVKAGVGGFSVVGDSES